MATTKTKKQPKQVLTDADNPSLIVVGGATHLRVLDDFFIETKLPKWVKFKQNWNGLKEELKASYTDASEYERAIEALEDPEKQKAYRERLKALKAEKKKLDDDRWNIKGKHEEAVDEAIAKTARLSRPPTFMEKIKIKLGLMKPLISVDVAFADLKEHLIHVSTEEMAKKMDVVTALEKRFIDNGQYNKAEEIKLFRNELVTEATLVSAGYDKFVNEEMMIDFIKKSERGVMVDFLRYYEGVIPDDVAAKKKEADDKLIFDNYVVAYYADIKKVAKKKETKKVEKKAKKEVEKRRDPILFGVIKESRKLIYIADWVTETDDLTLAVLEEALGKKAKTLSKDGILDGEVHSEVHRDVRNSVEESSGTLYSPASIYNSSPSTIVEYDIDDVGNSTRRYVRTVLQASGNT